jgi:hypothetical protein
MFYLKCLQGANKGNSFCFLGFPSQNQGISQETAAEVWPRGNPIQCTGWPQRTQFACLTDLHLTIKSVQECEGRAELELSLGSWVDEPGFEV